ncbi:hypothetical protein FACS189434_07110 [Bacteroidia bacterium]|nr:hypothetical protein FACS189434_07110 [Bacteroidia bacterium]
MESSIIPIGKLIKQKLADNDRSMAWLAKKVDCERSNFCKKLKRNDVSVDLLCRISKTLEEDFFCHCSKLLNGEI